MQNHITITEIAKESGVSISTVSRVLNGNVPVSQDKRERVEAAIRKYNYSPNALARSLVSKQTLTIGIILPDISNPYFSDLFCEIEQAAHDAGYSILLCNTLYHSGSKSFLEEDYLQMMVNKHVDGLIIAGGQQDLTHPGNSYLEAVKHTASILPTIMIGAEIADIPCLFLNREKTNGIDHAIRYLASLGHKRIAFLGGEDHVKITMSRIASYKNALSALNLPIDERLIILTDYYVSDGYRAVNLLLEKDIPFTAALAINENVALGAIRAFHDNGFRIPEDISLISCEQFANADFFTPRLTSINLHNRDFGKQIIEKLLNLIGGKEGNSNIDILPELVLRESCGTAVVTRTIYK